MSMIIFLTVERNNREPKENNFSVDPPDLDVQRRDWEGPVPVAEPRLTPKNPTADPEAIEIWESEGGPPSPYIPE